MMGLSLVEDAVEEEVGVEYSVRESSGGATVSSRLQLSPVVQQLKRET